MISTFVSSVWNSVVRSIPKVWYCVISWPINGLEHRKWISIQHISYEEWKYYCNFPHSQTHQSIPVSTNNLQWLRFYSTLRIHFKIRSNVCTIYLSVKPFLVLYGTFSHNIILTQYIHKYDLIYIGILWNFYKVSLYPAYALVFFQ